jgi:hemerythrin superfamily protein
VEAQTQTPRGDPSATFDRPAPLLLAPVYEARFSPCGVVFTKGTTTMGTMNDFKTGDDVVTYLKQQHKQVKAMLTKVLESTGKKREAAFGDLRRMLAIHETAEEEIVHPAARSLPGGDAEVAARLKEENGAKKALIVLEKLDVDSAEFETKFRALQADVLAHAESEEKLEFDRLGSKLDPAQLKRMKKAVELAESVAPTHVHPGMESAAANFLAGPFVAMVDRTRDALSDKHGHR